MTNKSVPVSLEELRHQLVDRLWFGSFIIGIIGVPISISRYLATGWMPLYNLHVVLGLIFTCVYLLKNKLSYFYKKLFLIGVFFTVGIFGMFTIGNLGAGVWWLIMSAFLISTLYSLKAGLWALLLSSIVVILSGYLFSSGILSIGFDANVYIRSHTSWITLLVGASFMPFIILQSLAQFQHATVSLLKEVDKQKTIINELAKRDQLTGLDMLSQTNDNLLSAIEKADKHGYKVALFFIDLDDFKAVNDKHGHDAGDHVLIEVAQRLRKHLNNKDSASRIGGDEFIVILPKIEQLESVNNIARNMVDELSKPYKYGEYVINIGASIGISIYHNNGLDPKSLKILADKAMYSVKNTGKKGFAIANNS